MGNGSLGGNPGGFWTKVRQVVMKSEIAWVVKYYNHLGGWDNG
jgi:hypothetical protein